jgi:tetratricopeptide (TPR) repeat protein
MYDQLARWLAEETNGPWLLVIDGADDSDMVLDQDLLQAPKPDRLLTRKPLIDFVPRRLDHRRRLLFSTRSRDIADAAVSANSPVHIGAFSVEEARLLLLRKLGSGISPPSSDVANQFLEILGYIPLAITQAAAFVNRNGGNLQQHLLAFEHSDSDRKLQLSIELQDPRRERGVPNSIYRTWKLSFDQIRQRDEEAANILSIMSLLDGQSIPETLIKSGSIADTAWRHSLGTILGYSLAFQGPEGIVTMHPLVQMCVRYWLQQEGRFANYVKKVIQLLASKFPTGDFENRDACQALWAQAETALHYQTVCDESGAALLHNMAWFEWGAGYFDPAEIHIRKSYDARQQLLGENSKLTLSTLSLMAIILQARGNYPAAEEIQQKALKGRQETLGLDHPDTIRTANNLATILRDQGNYEAAEAMHRQALSSRERVFGPNHPSTLVSVNNLGLLLRDRGKYEAAEEMHRRALQGQQQALGPNHPSTLTKLNNLARVLVDQGKYEDAEQLHRKALEGREKVLGVDHPDTLKSVDNLGTVLTSQGKFQAAGETLRRALEGRKKALGPNHPDTLRSMNNLATVLVKLDMLNRAEEMHRAALAGREKALGEAHPDTLRSVRDLAYLFRLTGRLREAQENFRRACTGFLAALGETHPATVSCLRDYEMLKEEMDDRHATEKQIEGNKRRKVHRTRAKLKQSNSGGLRE